MKPRALSDAERWLTQARNDLRDARGLADKLSSHATACFHAQQSAEKALKAVLIALGEEPWGHSVSLLLEGVSAFLEVPAEVLDGAQLDQYYIPTRYPNGLPGGVADDVYSEDDSSSAIALAETVLQFATEEIHGRLRS